MWSPRKPGALEGKKKSLIVELRGPRGTELLRARLDVFSPRGGCLRVGTKDRTEGLVGGGGPRTCGCGSLWAPGSENQSLGPGTVQGVCPKEACLRGG